MLDQANTLEEIEEARREGLKLLESIRDDSRDPLKLESSEKSMLFRTSCQSLYSNNAGEMGVQTDRSIYLSAIPVTIPL